MDVSLMKHALGSWKLSDGTEIPAVLDHTRSQQQLLDAQTPGTHRKAGKRGLDSAQTAHEAMRVLREGMKS